MSKHAALIQRVVFVYTLAFVILYLYKSFFLFIIYLHIANILYFTYFTNLKYLFGGR